MRTPARNSFRKRQRSAQDRSVPLRSGAAPPPPSLDWGDLSFQVRCRPSLFNVYKLRARKKVTALAELNYKTKAGQEGFVKVMMPIRHKNCEARECFNPLQQIVCFNIGEPVMSVLDVGSFAKQSICLIEKENRVALLRIIKDPDQVLFCLTDEL